MTRFALHRLLDCLIAVWGVTTLIFFLVRVLGDPALLLLPPGADEAQIQQLRSALGLDQPIIVQYVQFLWNMLHGDFGESFQQARPALDVILERLPATALLAAAGLIVGTVFGLAAGMLAAVRRGHPISFAVVGATLVGQAMPTFWLGLMLILVFAVDLHWVPTGGYGTASALILPGITLAAFVAAGVARLFRSSLLDALREDHVRTARAKGLSPVTVLLWHVARNALIPTVTLLGMTAGELLGGAVVIETVFAWPGAGQAIIQAIEIRDFPVVQAGIAVVTAMFVLVTLVVDLLYGVLDPRIRGRG